MDDFIYLADLINFLRKRLLIIAIITFVVTLFSVFLSFTIKKSFTTELTGFIPEQQSLSLPQNQSMDSSHESNSTPLGMVQSEQPPSLIMLFLHSRSLKLRVIKALNLENNKIFSGDIRNKTDENLINKLSAMLIIIQPETGEFKIIIRGPDPDLVKDIADETVKQLHVLMKEQNNTNSNELKRQIIEAENKLEDYEERLSEYERSHKNTFIDQKTQEQINAYVEIKKRIFLVDADISKYRGMKQIQGNIAILSEIDKRIAALIKERESLELNMSAMDKEYINMPEDELKLLRLKRQYEVNENLLIMLNGQYSLSLVSEDKESNVIIVDPPFKPHIHSYPSKKVIAIASAFFGMLLGFFVAYFMNVSDIKKSA